MRQFYLLLCLACLATPLTAQDSITLAPLDVTAPTWVAQPATNPAPVSTLADKQLQEVYYGQEPAILLTRQPGITAYTDAGSPFGYAYLRLRGIDQTRLNFTLDGVPLNEPEDQGFYFNNYADLLSSIRGVQIQRGVNVRVNGTAAYAGSVQMLTPALNQDEFTEISLGGGSYGGYRASAALQRATEEGWTYYARATALGSNGYKRNSEHDAQSVFLQTGRVGEGDLLKFTFFGGRQTNQMAWLGVRDSVLQTDPRANDNDPVERDAFVTTLAKAQYTRFWGEAEWTSNLYYGFQDGNYDFNLGNFLEVTDDLGVYNYAFRYHNVGLVTNLHRQFDRLSLRAGLHAQRHNRRHRGTLKPGIDLYENTGRKTDLSGVLSGEYTFRKLALRGAAQLRHVAFGYAGAVGLPTQSNTFFNYEASAALAVREGANLYYKFGHTGREPTRNDLFAGEDDLLEENGEPVLGVTAPEFVYDHEFGIAGKLEATNYRINLFYLDFEDEITLSGAFGPNGLPLRSSVAQSYRAGVEVSAGHRFSERFTVTLNGSWMRSRIKQGGARFEPVLTPELLVQPGVTYRYRSWFVGLDGRYQSSSFVDLANANSIEAFATLDARAGVVWGRWSVTGYLFNLTDEAYSTNGQLDVYGRPTFHRRAGVNGWVTVGFSL